MQGTADCGRRKFSLSSPEAELHCGRVKIRYEPAEAGSLRGGCEGGERLLKFLVCWDAAVCAVSAGGFLSVWNGVRKTNVWYSVRKTNDWRLAFWPDPLEFLRA